MAVAGVAGLLSLAAVQESQSGDREWTRVGEGQAARSDVCGEVMQANHAELRKEELSSDRGAGSAPGKGYSLLGAWPAGSGNTVIYGGLFPDQSIERRGNPEDLAGLGITSSVRQEELGELPEGASYAYELSSAGQPNQELDLLGVRWEDGSIFDLVVLPDGSACPHFFVRR